jgi:hypothetical protein
VKSPKQSSPASRWVLVDDGYEVLPEHVRRDRNGQPTPLHMATIDRPSRDC